MWRFPNCWGYPKLSKSMTMTTIETHGFSDWGSSILGHPPMNVSIIFGSFGSSWNQLSEAYTEKLSSKSVTIQNSRPAWNHKIVFNALLVIKRCFLVAQNPVILFDFDGLDRKLMCVVLPTWDTERLSWSKISAFSGTWFFSLPKVAAYFQRTHSIQEMKKFDAVELGPRRQQFTLVDTKKVDHMKRPSENMVDVGVSKICDKTF